MKQVTSDDGVEIAYDVWGRRDGPPVLLIQGLGTDSRGWALQRMAFGRHYRCFAPDNRGVGHTGPTAQPSSKHPLHQCGNKPTLFRTESPS